MVKTMMHANIEQARKIGIVPEKFKIITLYILLSAGGLWHVLGVFQGLMALLAGPLVVGISLWIFFVCRQAHGETQILKTKAAPALLSRFSAWSAAVVLVSFGIEWVGVQTGAVFGEYRYGQTLRPQLGGVPLAIGFAWLGMLLSSVALLQKAIPRFADRNPAALGLAAGLLMVLFDVVMEPAAIALGYWSWSGNVVPLQNYLAWWLISFLFTFGGLQLGLFREKLPAPALHAFFAQLLYFAIVGLI